MGTGLKESRGWSYRTNINKVSYPDILQGTKIRTYEPLVKFKSSVV